MDPARRPGSPGPPALQLPSRREQDATNATASPKKKIVAGSKALHHVLPELVPPIDREYTLRFFFHTTNLPHREELAFRTVYPCFWKIATSCRKEIECRLGRGMNTSITKVIDNAVVGYGLRHLKGQARRTGA
jgi:hypothetical protein